MADQELDAQVVLSAEDRASPAANRAADAFSRAQTQVEKFSQSAKNLLKNTLFTAAGAAGIGYGIHGIIGNIIHGRKELETLENAITGVNFAFQEWNQSLSTTDRLKAARQESKAFLGDIENLESRLAIGADRIASAYTDLAGPVYGRLGKSQQDMLGLLTKSAEAAKVFQVDVGMVGDKVAKALSLGVIAGNDPLSRHLQTALGNMKKLTEEERFRRISKELSGFGKAAEEMSMSMSDVAFRVKDFFGDFIRDAGGPVMTYILEKIDGWRKKLEQTTSTGRKLSDVYGEKILTFFKKAEEVVGTLLKYWKEIAILVGGIKLGGMVGGAAGGLGDIMQAFAGPLGAAGQGLSNFAGKLSVGVGALGAFYAGLSFAAKQVDAWQSRNLAAQDKAQQVAQVVSATNEKAAYDIAKSMGLIDAQTGKVTVSMQGLQRGFDRMDEEVVRRLGGKLGFGGAVEEKAGEIFARHLEDLSKKHFVKPSLDAEVAQPSAIHPKGIRKAQITQNFGNVYVQQDFKEGDPDRVFIRMKQGFEGLAEKRLQSGLSEVYGE